MNLPLIEDYVPKATVTTMIKELRKPQDNSLNEKLIYLYWSYRLVKWKLFGYDQKIINGRMERVK